jgi:hypothetical protein
VVAIQLSSQIMEYYLSPYVYFALAGMSTGGKVLDILNTNITTSSQNSGTSPAVLG